jgi:hypothetical protein
MRTILQNSELMAHIMIAADEASTMTWKLTKKVREDEMFDICNDTPVYWSLPHRELI